MKGDYLIPFDNDGNQLSYDEGWAPGTHKPTKFVQNFEFEDTLTYMTFGRGRSSVVFHFKRESNGRQVTMFVSDLSDVIPHLKKGKLTGTFTFVKKGSNYGCKMVYINSDLDVS